MDTWQQGIPVEDAGITEGNVNMEGAMGGEKGVLSSGHVRWLRPFIHRQHLASLLLLSYSVLVFAYSVFITVTGACSLDYLLFSAVVSIRE